jgi:hypothetical protein
MDVTKGDGGAEEPGMEPGEGTTREGARQDPAVRAPKPFCLEYVKNKTKEMCPPAHPNNTAEQSITEVEGDLVIFKKVIS